jgi:hypothetical protein
MHQGAVRHRDGRLSRSSRNTVRGVLEDDPRNWRLDVPEPCIDLYSELRERPRDLTAEEAQMLVALVDAWRAHEHRKHIALMAALAQREDG